MKRQSRCDLTNDFSDDALRRSNKDPEDSVTMKKSTEMKKLSHEDLSYSNSRRKNSESNAEELALTSPYAIQNTTIN